MLHVAEIWIHPVKSLGGYRVASAEVDERGLVGDRRFMLVDAAGVFVSQRTCASMAGVAARASGGFVELRAAGRPPLRVAVDVEGEPREVRIWRDTLSALDAGPEAAGWLSEALGREVRLVRLPPSVRRPVASPPARPFDQVALADAFAFLLISDASLVAVAARVALPIDARRFRPSFVIGGVAEAFDEDRWVELEVGPLRLHPCKPCARCAIVDVDPDTGERATAASGTSVLAALATLTRRDNEVFFGQNAVHDGAGTIREGDGVAVLRRAGA